MEKYNFYAWSMMMPQFCKFADFNKQNHKNLGIIFPSNKKVH